MARGAAILAVLALLQDTAYFDPEPNWTAPDEGGTNIFGGADGSFGMGFGPVGDVDGDGFDDLLVAAPLRDNTPDAGSGKAFLFRGSAAGLSSSPSWTVTGESQGVEELGHEAGMLGDVNGDGFDDLFVASEDGVLGFLGSAAGPGASAHWRFDAKTAAAAGDVNGDGFGDVITGDPFGGPGGSAILAVFFGSSAGLRATPDWTFVYSGPIQDLGRTVRGLGDVNRDGFDDVAAGNAGNRFDRSGILVFHGSATGPSSAPEWTFERDGSERFGGDLEGGDFNGDGFADLLTSAHGTGGSEGDPDTQTHRPKTYMFYGSAAGLSLTPTFVHEGSGGEFGLFVVNLTDLDGDGLSEIGVATRQDLQVFRGAPVGYETTPAWTFGPSWDPQAAGDGNGDGRMDLVLERLDDSGHAVVVFYGRLGGNPEPPPVDPPPMDPPPMDPPPMDPPPMDPPPADPPPADPPPANPPQSDDDDDDRCGALGAEALLLTLLLTRRRPHP